MLQAINCITGTNLSSLIKTIMKPLLSTKEKEDRGQRAAELTRDISTAEKLLETSRIRLREEVRR